MAGITYRDEIVIYRVLAVDVTARDFLAALKERLKIDFEQLDILIVERDVNTL
jgi:hypothetical protein